MKRISLLLILAFLMIALPAQAERTVYADQNGVYVFSQNEKVGLMAADGHLLADPVYDCIMPFDGNDCAVVKRNGGKGLMRRDGTEVIECKWDDIYYYPSMNLATTVIWFYKNKEAWKDIAKEFPGHYQYAELRDLITGECLFRGNDWYDIEEDRIFVTQYEYYDGFEAWGPYHTDVYDRERNLLFSQEYNFKSMNDRWLLWADSDKDILDWDVICAMTDLQGNIILDGCSDIQLDRDGYAVYEKRIRNPFAKLLKNLEWSNYRIRNTLVSDLGIELETASRLLAWLEDVYITGIVDPNGVCAEFEGDWIYPSNGSGRFLVETKKAYHSNDSQYRYVNAKGETLFGKVFEDASEFFGGSAIVSDDGEEYYMIDLDGNRLGAASWPVEGNKFDHSFSKPNWATLLVFINNQIRLVDRTGNFTTDEVFPRHGFKYGSYHRAGDLLCLRDMDGNVCLVGEDGEVFARLKDMEDPEVSDVIDGAVAIGDVGAMGLMRVSGDKRGEWILEPEYHCIDDFWGINYFKCTDGSRIYHILDPQGNILTQYSID